MSESLLHSAQVEQWGWVLVHSCWQFALLAWFAWLAGMVFRRHSPATRYGIYLVTLAAVIVAPILTGWQITVESTNGQSKTPSVAFEPMSGASRPSRVNADLSPQSIESSSGVAPVASAVAGQESDAAWQTSGSVNQSWPVVTRRFEAWLPIMVGVWGLGVLAFACRPLLGWYVVRRLRIVGVSAVSSSLQDLLSRTARKLGLKQAVGLCHSSLVHAPVVVGYFKPVILLPLSVVSELTFPQLEAIIAHELAHVRRHDYLVNLLQTLIETIFFYHPAVWWLSRQIRIEREHCCDDIAVTALGDRLEYSRALLAIEERRGARMTLALGAGGGPLLARVRRLLAVETNPPQSSLPGIIAVATLVVTCASLGLGLTGGKQTAAQEPPSKTEEVKSEESPTHVPSAAREASGNGRQPVGRPPELPHDLEKKFHDWDQEYRHKSEEKFLELERIATELANRTADPDQQASIYAQVAHIAGQSTITKHVQRVRRFATKSLETSRNPLQRAYLHSLVGSTYEIDPAVKEFSERRRLAAERFLTGWVELLSYDVPDKAPELPVVGGIVSKVEDPAEAEKMRKINQAQAAARQQAQYVRDLVNHRDMLANQLRWLFHPDPKDPQRGPEGPDELRRIAAKMVAEFESERLLQWVTAENPLHPEQQRVALTAPGSVLDHEVSTYVRTTPLHELLTTLVTSAGGELQLDSDGLKEVGVTRNAPITLRVEKVSLRAALTTALSSYPQVSFTQVGKIVFVSSLERVKNRADAAQSAKAAVLKKFAGDWYLAGEGVAEQINQPLPQSEVVIRFRCTENEVLRMKNWDPYGWGILDVDPSGTSPTFVIQFTDAGGDAGYLRGDYKFLPDGSLWLNVLGPYQQRGTFVEARGNVPWAMHLKRDVEKSETESRKTSTLEFRFAANPPESKAEPRVPADYLQRHYRDGTQKDPGPDKGFAWFPIADIASSQIDLPLEGVIGKQRRALLSDDPQHSLLANGEWKVEKCEVVPDQNRFAIRLRLDEAGGTKFTKLTQTYLNQKLAIVVDGTIFAAPTVRETIGVDVMITGRFSRDAADKLAEAIRK